YCYFNRYHFIYHSKQTNYDPFTKGCQYYIRSCEWKFNDSFHGLSRKRRNREVGSSCEQDERLYPEYFNYGNKNITTMKQKELRITTMSVQCTSKTELHLL